MNVKNLKNNIKKDAIKPGELVLINETKCFNFEGMTKGSNPIGVSARIIELAINTNDTTYEVNLWFKDTSEYFDERYFNSYEEALNYIKDIIEEYSE